MICPDTLKLVARCVCISKKFRDTPLESQRQHQLNQSQSSHCEYDSEFH